MRLAYKSHVCPRSSCPLNLSRKKDDECASSATVSINLRAKPPAEPVAAPDQPNEAAHRVTSRGSTRAGVIRLVPGSLRRGGPKFSIGYGHLNPCGVRTGAVGRIYWQSRSKNKRGTMFLKAVLHSACIIWCRPIAPPRAPIAKAERGRRHR